jgi:hypothetical protein
MRLQTPTLPVLVLLGILGLAGCNGASRPAGPAAEFPHRRHDFGTVVQGTRVEHAFVVRNPGSADLLIQAVEARPPLTARFDRVVPAGGQGQIRVALDTAGLHGQGELHVGVHTNDPNVPGKVLALAGRIVPVVEVTPRDRAYFFTVKGQGGEQRLTLVNHGSRPVEAGEATSDNPYFHPRVSPLAPGQRYEVVITLDPATPAGRYKGTVVIPTGLDALPQVEIPVRAAIDEAAGAGGLGSGRGAPARPAGPDGRSRSAPPPIR